MGLFLLFILIIFFTIVILGFSFLRGIIRLFIRRPSTSPNTSYEHSDYGFNKKKYNNQTQDSNLHKKVFTKDEGEYIDFEEIKV